ncbi:glycosyltransferase family 4 protein [Daejeonella sp.]|uniref:glycosyltransferase family 4 protein n=1 Tax=Daejeonella sp. TaxID=2805397 RepID=UPI0030BEDEEE
MIIYISESINSKKNGGSSTSGFEFFQFLRMKYNDVVLITNDHIEFEPGNERFYGKAVGQIHKTLVLKRDSTLLNFTFRSLLRSLYYSVFDLFKLRKVDISKYYQPNRENIIYVNSWSSLYNDSRLENYKDFKKVCIVRGSPESFVWQSFDVDKNKAVSDAAKYLELFDNLIFVSDNGRKAWAPILAHPIKSYYLPNSINEEEVNRVKKLTEQEAKDLLNLDSSCFNVIVIGSIQKRKAQDIILKIIEKVSSDIPNVKFHMVGIISSTWGGDIIYNDMTNSKFANHFVFHGHSEEAMVYMRAGDIMLFTSYAEAFPRTVAEYMAMGKPIIAADVSGVGEMIIHNYNGYLYDPFQPEAVIEFLSSLYKDSDLRHKFSNEAYKTYHDKFSKEVHIQAALKVFDEIEKE